MRFSIVIPLYNKERYIAETLDSVQGQTFQDYEVIIVDDSSTDKSRDIAKTYEGAERFHVYTVPNGGVSAARNYGIEKACGDYVCFLDADDLWRPEYLQETDRLLKKYGDRDFLCFGYDSFEGTKDNVVWHRNLRKLFSDDDRLIDFYKYSVLSMCSVALTSAVVIKRTRLQKLDYCFPEGISMGEDIDLWVRAAADGDIVYSNNTLMLYRYFSEGCLTQAYTQNVDKSYPYWQWYALPCYSTYKNRFTTRMVYAVALKALETSGRKTREILRHIRGTYLLPNIIGLYLYSFIKADSSDGKNRK